MREGDDGHALRRVKARRKTARSTRSENRGWRKLDEKVVVVAVRGGCCDEGPQLVLLGDGPTGTELRRHKNVKNFVNFIINSLMI